MPRPTARRVAVTGAGGFVGANLVRGLVDEGDEVVAVVAPWTDARRLDGVAAHVERCDLRVREAAARLLERVHPQVVVNLAVARPTGDPGDAERCFRTNVGATAAVIEASAAAGAQVVHLGSSTEYAASERPLRETDPIGAATLYGASKAAGTLLCLALARSRGAEVVVLRAFMVYGPWDHTRRFVPTALEAAATGRELRLTPPGFRRDWTYVGDLVEACLRASRAAGLAGMVLNVGTGREATPEDVAALLGEISGRPLRTLPGAEPPRPWDRSRWVADVSALERALGWRPATSLHNGLRSTWEWYLRRRREAA
jgi:nucleoside-diphosphate-sugar epimerase